MYEITALGPMDSGITPVTSTVGSEVEVASEVQAYVDAEYDHGEVVGPNGLRFFWYWDDEQECIVTEADE